MNRYCHTVIVDAEQITEANSFETDLPGVGTVRIAPDYGFFLIPHLGGWVVRSPGQDEPVFYTDADFTAHFSPCDP